DDCCQARLFPTLAWQPKIFVKGLNNLAENPTGFVGPVTCPACSSETRFWMQENARAMCPCTARRTFTAEELNLKTLGDSAGIDD
ncbi:MAG: hypothetical protein VW713_05345, partial [Alphaproteobacteria bacterium]